MYFFLGKLYPRARSASIAQLVCCMSCTKADCACPTFVESKLRFKKFIGVCVECSHGHTDEDDLRRLHAMDTDSKPVEIVPQLYIGNIFAALDVAALRAANISHIVNCCPNAFGFTTKKVAE